MKPFGWVLLIGVVNVNAAWAGAQCPDLGVAYLERPSSEIRELAQSCTDKPLADLYYKRAYHLEFLERSTNREEMVIVYGSQRSWLSSYRMYIALIEALSEHWFSNPQARIEFLRDEYERRGEIAELRLRGMDRLADRLEREEAPLLR